MINIYYNYLLLIILEFINRYEKITTITKDKIETSLKIYMEMLKKDCIQIEELKNINKVLKEISNYNQDELLKKFAITYSDITYLKDNKLYLKEEITSDNIEEKIQEINMNYPETTCILEPYNIDSEKLEELKQILKVKTIDNILEEYLQIEYLIEYLYYFLYSSQNINLTSKIEKLLAVRAKILKLIEKLDLTDKQTYQEAITCIKIKEQKDYDILPIDSQIDKEYLEMNLYNTYQYAIFSENLNHCNYVEQKINTAYFSELEALPLDQSDFDYENDENFDYVEDEDFNYEEDYDIDNYENEEELFEENEQELFESDEEEQYFTEESEIVRYFYLTYLQKLNEYIISTPDKELINVKRRLLYVLDNQEDKLYLNDKNISIAINNIEDNEEITVYCNQIKKEVYMMIADIFKTEDKNTLKKVLFISTYYQLTKDEEVLNLLNENTIHPRYLEYKRIIIGPQEKNKTKTKNL